MDLTELIADACKLAHVSRDFVMSFALLPEEYSMHIWAVPTLSLSCVAQLLEAAASHSSADQNSTGSKYSRTILLVASKQCGEKFRTRIQYRSILRSLGVAQLS